MEMVLKGLDIGFTQGLQRLGESAGRRCRHRKGCGRKPSAGRRMDHPAVAGSR